MEQQMEQQVREEIKKNHLLDDRKASKKEHQISTKRGTSSSHISEKSYTNDELKDIYENMSLDRIVHIWKVHKNKKLTDDQLNEFDILRKVYEKKSGRKLNANTQGKK